MRYFVNSSCVGCGLCEGTCPEVFHMTDEGVAEAIQEDVPEECLGTAADAQSGCPAAAIEEAQ